MKADTGAAAALRRLETHELEASQEVASLRKQLEDLRAMQDPVGDDSLRIHRNKLAQAVDALASAQESWIKTLKSLREFDKAVAPAAREGEKIPRSEVERIITMVFLSDRIAFETHLLSISQDAIRCVDEQDYYAKFASSHRACREQAIISAIEHEKTPAWVKDCWEKSL